MSLHKSAMTKNIAELRMETGTSAYKQELCKQRNAPIFSNCSRTNMPAGLNANGIDLELSMH